MLDLHWKNRSSSKAMQGLFVVAVEWPKHNYCVLLLKKAFTIEISLLYKHT